MEPNSYPLPVGGRARDLSREPIPEFLPAIPTPPQRESMAFQEQEGPGHLGEESSGQYRYMFEDEHHRLTPSSMLGGGGGVAQGRGSGLGDQRALQIALELSKMGMVDSSSSSSMAGASGTSPDSHRGFMQHRSFMQQAVANGIIPPESMIPPTSSFMYGVGDSYLNFGNEFGQFGYMMPKKSQNITECVPVPSCEHVAEIVGRQGCKIKTLRAKTNTYIKTPVRGEEPVFVVTGRKDDVNAAKREILNAAEHFSQIRASRGLANGNAPPAVPGQITVQIKVPYRVVGLVVGPKGATIKRIQQQTHTYIVTPSRDNDPVFEVTGMPEHVEMAKTEIESHIAIRTGSLPMDDQCQVLDQDDQTGSSDLLASLYKNGLTGLGGFGGLERIGIGLSAVNSLPSSLSGSVTDLVVAAQNGLGNGGPLNNGVSASSSNGGGGSLPSLSFLNGFSSGMGPGGIGGPTSAVSRQPDTHMHTQLSDLGFSFLDTTNGKNGCMSSSNSDDSYLFGGSGPNSNRGSQTKLSELFAAIGANNTVSFTSSLWGAFDRDEGLGESPTPETSPGANFM